MLTALAYAEAPGLTLGYGTRSSPHWAWKSTNSSSRRSSRRRPRAERECTTGNRQPADADRSIRHRAARQRDLERPGAHDHVNLRREPRLHRQTIHPLTTYAMSGLGTTERAATRPHVPAPPSPKDSPFAAGKSRTPGPQSSPSCVASTFCSRWKVGTFREPDWCWRRGVRRGRGRHPSSAALGRL